MLSKDAMQMSISHRMGPNSPKWGNKNLLCSTSTWHPYYHANAIWFLEHTPFLSQECGYCYTNIFPPQINTYGPAMEPFGLHNRVNKKKVQDIWFKLGYRRTKEIDLQTKITPLGNNPFSPVFIHTCTHTISEPSIIYTKSELYISRSFPQQMGYGHTPHLLCYLSVYFSPRQIQVIRKIKKW